MTIDHENNVSDEIAKRRPRKRLRIILIAAAIIMISGLGLVYLDTVIDKGSSHQIFMREKFPAIGSKISASDFAADQLDEYCFEPIAYHKEILNELYKDARFYRNNLSDRALASFWFLIFTGPGGTKYAMVRNLNYLFIQFTDAERKALPECWPLSLITIELERSFRDGSSKSGVEEIGLVVTINNK